MTTTHGPTIETRTANHRDGLMTWPAVQWQNVGPFIFARRINGDGQLGPRVFAAIALDPTRYIRATSSALDVLPAGMRNQ